MRTLVALSTAALLALPMAAQDNDPDNAVAGGMMPAGWMARADRGSMENVNFRTMAPGWHFTVGPAAIYWRPEYTAEGNYTITANMSQTTAPRHPEGQCTQSVASERVPGEMSPFAKLAELRKSRR